MKPSHFTFSLKLALPLLLLTLMARWLVGGNNAGICHLPSRRAYNLPALPKSRPISLTFEEYANGLNGTITGIRHAGDSRLFVTTKNGYIRVIKDDKLLKTPFLDISTQVGTGFEEGLLGIAFHPNYPQTPYFYIQYTRNTGSHPVIIARYSVSNNPDIADPDSVQVILEIEKSSYIDPGGNLNYSNVHNGGDLTFGPDGYLYIPVGDGGPDPFLGYEYLGDKDNDSQRLDKLLGKVLRIDVDPTAGLPSVCWESGHYSIPADNPFVDNDDDTCDEIWAYGFRNPWRMSFDRETGDLFVSDVGEWIHEEVNIIPAGVGGLNFGWHCYEGTATQPQNNCSLPNTVFPIHEYPEVGANEVNSITGGYVYRGNNYPALQGNYLFSDFMTQDIYMLTPQAGTWSVKVVGHENAGITTFGEDVNGELYYGTYIPARIYKIEAE